MWGRRETLQNVISKKTGADFKKLPRFLANDLRNLSEKLEKAQSEAEFDQILSSYRNIDRELKKHAGLDYRDFKEVIYGLKKSYKL